jgi:hypothetical protein
VDDSGENEFEPSVLIFNPLVVLLCFGSAFVGQARKQAFLLSDNTRSNFCPMYEMPRSLRPVVVAGTRGVTAKSPKWQGRHRQVSGPRQTQKSEELQQRCLD